MLIQIDKTKKNSVYKIHWTEVNISQTLFEKDTPFLDMQKTCDFSSLWQTPSWQEIGLHGWTMDKSIGLIEVDKNKSITGYGFFEKRSIGLGQFGLFCIGGPMWEVSEVFWSILKKIAHDEKVLFIQTEPLEWANKKQKVFKKFIEPLTALLDLSLPQENLLANMKQKGRYNIKQAQKHDIQVEQVSTTKKNIETFFSLLQSTTSRNKFATNSKIFFEQILKNSQHKLYFAKKDDVVIAAGIFSFVGNTCTYYYGASSSEPQYRKMMAPYLLQWQVITDAQSAWYKWYDFLGIADSKDTKSHLAGVTNFKLKFGPIIHKWPNGNIMIINKKYYLFSLLKKIRNSIKK